MDAGLVWLKASPRQLLPGSHPDPRAHKIDGLDELPGTGSFLKMQSKLLRNSDVG